jgi:hypothetical protein
MPKPSSNPNLLRFRKGGKIFFEKKSDKTQLDPDCVSLSVRSAFAEYANGKLRTESETQSGSCCVLSDLFCLTCVLSDVFCQRKSRKRDSKMNLTNISNFSQPLESDEITSTFSACLTEAETAGLIVFLVLFAFAGFLQNLVLILSISLTVGFPDAPVNLFVLSLACADLLLCAVPAPLLIYNIYHSIFSIFITVTNFVIAATTGSIFLLTLNRLVSTVRPLKYPKIMTFRRTVTMIGVIWFVAVLGGFVHMFIGKKHFPITRSIMVFYSIQGV